jgi:hypothetical protein
VYETNNRINNIYQKLSGKVFHYSWVYKGWYKVSYYSTDGLEIIQEKHIPYLEERNLKEYLRLAKEHFYKEVLGD